MKNPFANRNLTKQLAWPKLSWSSMNAFESYDKEDWYQQYVLGIRGEVNAAMQAGIEIGERLATDPTFLPEVPRPKIYEHSIETKFGAIAILGHMDGWTPRKKELIEYKTSQNEKRWTQDAVDEWGQLSFYALLLYLKNNIHPADLRIRLVSIPVKMDGSFKVVLTRNPPKVVETTRSMIDILNFGVRLKKVYAEMQAYVDNHLD